MFAAIIVAAVMATAWFFIKSGFSRVKLDMPYLEFEGDNSAARYASGTREIMKKGYEQYIKKGLPFSMFNHVNYSHPLVILPTKYLDELRQAPQSKLSFPIYLEKLTIVNDIGGPKMTDESIHVIKMELSRNLNWTPVITFQFMLKLFSRITSRVFVGPELCENDAWLGVILGYTNSAFRATHGVRAKYHPSMRWLAKYIDKDVKDVYKFRQMARNLLRPVLEARIADAKAESEGEPASYADAVRWLYDAYRSKSKTMSLDTLAQDEFVIAVASIHSTAATAVSILYDLLDHPDSLAEIQDEIRQVSGQYGEWTRKSLGQLRILDSFMKESQRMHTLQQVTMQRLAVTPYTFKDGLHIPSGTQVSIPNELLGLDPELHENADIFDAKRFLRVTQEGEINRFQFGAVCDNLLSWGSGHHACPGRFLAQEVMKLMFIQLLTNYQVQYPAGVKSRPADILRHHQIMPALAVPLAFKEI
ncbi:hypothetical protein S7711_07100 [Stachybotrys chartarum IBT 7711]|uniref:Cytochrome P450 n=1 Tax=Stachybotrys chartarum (strain CBS 109288 / IBT 7711) TaxID=1280523 RepID=A0A084B322_STACB|nr:hypothetical protein S7711_07100 [Stachybotrys chartarum IBT 7711]KFA50682.1 hypothetical protein S40293_04876 [Stachybotrys chartarum IBT 40293]